MTDEDVEWVEIPLWLARDAADLFRDMAQSHYRHNATGWGDRYHGRAREMNDVTEDDWDDVGLNRFRERNDD